MTDRSSAVAIGFVAGFAFAMLAMWAVVFHDVRGYCIQQLDSAA